MVAMTNKKFSQKLLLIFVAVFVMGSICFPSVHADVGVAAAVAVDEDGETLDMDAPVVEEKIVREEKVEQEEEKVVVADEEPEVVEKEVEPEPEPEQTSESEPEPEPEPEQTSESEPEPEPATTATVEEEDTPAAVKEEKEESTEEIIQSENVSPNKISIPFLDKVTKQDVKKIAAFSLGAWGAATGVGWAMQQFGGEQKFD
eukprot:CAMPEP_0203683768 /NCGR_PEP_ID=MMETSP0090-20130426/47694_1 /ASSEMBLY_ACC=CAM_ASM_001088 /TAXON_ID=426623 /ORGANISM="Chaetoceros affinis, Strain CCMP159" /LENGTH=201 /DNA_ID=CAMNT_0050552923 /DNA_START=162 /DNA_END=767 /DNA_ORIENTATION=+